VVRKKRRSGPLKDKKDEEDIMDYRKLLSRAWNIIWEHKFLIPLGVLAALGGAGGGGNANVSLPGGDVGKFDLQLPHPEELGLPTGVLIGGVIVLIGIAIVIGIMLWAVSTIARGGLIAGGNAIESGVPTDFGQAWHAGWQRKWPLLGIGVLPAIPGFILGLGAIATIGSLYLVEAVPRVTNIGLVAPLAALTCVLVPIAVALNVLRTFANRACMLEELGGFAAYRRGVKVLLENISPALVLFLLQIAISIGLGIAFLLPSVVMVLRCLLWPVLLLVQGAIASYFSTLWTLAWREWTGLGHVGEIMA